MELGKINPLWGYWGILLFAISGHAGPLEPISTGLWGVPFSVPATYRAMEVRHEDDGVSDNVTEYLDKWEADGRLYFRSSDPVGQEPFSYEGELILGKDGDSISLGFLRTSQLRAFFKQLPYYTGNPVSIEVQPDVWAPAIFKDLVINVTHGGGPRLMARFQKVSLRRDYEIEKEVVYRINQEYWEIPWTQVESKVLPRSVNFHRLPALAHEQILFLAPTDEEAVPVVALGFATEPAKGQIPAQEFVYVVERRRLELHLNVSELPVYEVPAALLRTSTREGAERLRRQARAHYKTPDWLRVQQFGMRLEGTTPLTFTSASSLLTDRLRQQLGADKKLLPMVGNCEAHVLEAV